MSSFFESTTVSPDCPVSDKARAEKLRVAFAVVGMMIAEQWVAVDFKAQDWSGDFENKVKAVAEVLYEYQ